MSNLVFSSVNKIFGSGSSRYVALKNIDFEANSGELILVVGPSGSGKTTFLTIAGGLQTPTSGNVKLNNKTITKLNKREQTQLRLHKIGFVLQSYNLVPFLSVKEQFDLVDKVKKNNASAQELDQLLEDLDIVSLKEKYPNQLSGGQKQRVAIARALYTDPEYILADEPTAALDTERSSEVMRLLKELAHKRNKVIIVVTHDMRLKNNADKIYQIIDGKMSLISENL
ncbi:ABC transporter ATP-binding protein [Liquorilactobacillus sucicola DSM 21376 = JCM 15457]|uniref:ABC transporter ATP-binding component n=1 Tax=Liquorilactobacillus sucicola DSM 21376 = JCM 15457 TaxID=1423806 RepID=A0A023CYG5_9LACO|nr:ABC transporter ATP-binding protein [Liquorilactobacillus sucicola]KRN06661.1 ABC transporter ATP-binding component [Liquorilactobacillus sucicola DSM 21376 = JCM 15457]GAJ26927.1 ABC transporter ATP-binding protein [Liquorilactobacillus sucicola DSM 21376 = JCM 15457]